MASNHLGGKLDYVTQVSENIYFVKAPGRMLFPYANGFIFTGKETVLLDAGIGEAFIKEIDNLIRIDALIIIVFLKIIQERFLQWTLT